MAVLETDLRAQRRSSKQAFRPSLMNPAPRRQPDSIMITGASSGIGAALAEIYAGPGVGLWLSGRDEARLADAARRCRAKGAEVSTAIVDVRDASGISDWIAEADASRPLELVIANAGISAGTGNGGEDRQQTAEIFAVNLDGVVNTVMPAAAAMARRGRGQIGIMSSLAAFRGFPGAPAYCASKAAVRIWGEGLRGHLAPSGVGVSVICPGFVRSRITAVNDFPMPFLMDGSQAARIISRGLARNRARIAFPWPMFAATWLLSALPAGLTERLLARLPKKSGAAG